MKSCLFATLILICLCGCKSAEQAAPTVESGPKSSETPKVETKAAETKPGDSKITNSVDGSKTTIETKDSKTTLEKGKFTSENKDGTLTAGVDVTEAELGVPYYPGSKPTHQDVKTKAAKLTSVVSIRTSKDSPEAISKFYISKIGKPSSQSTTNGVTTCSWVSGPDKPANSLVIVQENGNSKLTLSSVKIAP